MPSAVVLINTETGKESKVLRELCAMREVESAYLVYGVYDLVIKVTTESMESLESFLMQRVRSLQGIKTTLTLIISKTC